MGRIRFIPTCVGNIVQVFVHRYSKSVHPHVCGEHPQADTIPDTVVGSSPRVWGTLRQSISNKCFQRFIPTCVGNIVPDSLIEIPLPVHPHVCGEHKDAEGPFNHFGGSSPRVWGTWHGADAGDLYQRFIPTCVGNITCAPWKRPKKPVHPHVCGEHCDGGGVFGDVYGSSPRVWGTWLRKWPKIWA